MARTSSERARRERRGVDRGGPYRATVYIVVVVAAPAGIRTRDLGTRASQRGGCAFEQRVERPGGDRAIVDHRPRTRSSSASEAEVIAAGKRRRSSLRVSMGGGEG